MTDKITSRCTAEERKNFTSARRWGPTWAMEPALGSLDERLSILVQRHGGRVRTPTLSGRERREYLAWLRDVDPNATNPYEKAS